MIMMRSGSRVVVDIESVPTPKKVSAVELWCRKLKAHMNLRPEGSKQRYTTTGKIVSQ